MITSVIDKVLNKFKKPKHSVCHSDSCFNREVLPFYSSIFLKISKILSHFGFKFSFRPNKIIFSSPKYAIPIENRSGINFTKACIVLFPISTTHLNSHEAFYILKNSNNLVNDFSSIRAISDEWKIACLKFSDSFKSFIHSLYIFIYFMFYYLLFTLFFSIFTSFNFN